MKFALLLSLPICIFACVQSDDPDDTDTDDLIEPLPTTAERRLLHEVFTGSNCGPCYESSERLTEVLDARPELYTVIKYQIGSDPYISREAVRRRMFYLPEEAETYAIPYVHADGVFDFHPNLMNDGAGYTTDDFDIYRAPESVVELKVTHEITDQTVTARVEMMALQELSSPDLLLHLAVIEKVTTQNVGSNGQEEFHYVFKKWIQDGGTPWTDVVVHESRTETLSYTFVGEYSSETGIANPVNHSVEHTVEEFEDLAVVAFVQDDNTLEVFQSAWTITH